MENHSMAFSKEICKAICNYITAFCFEDSLIFIQISGYPLYIYCYVSEDQRIHIRDKSYKKYD